LEPDPLGSGLPRAEADAIRNSSAYKYARQLLTQGAWVSRSRNAGRRYTEERRRLTPQEVLQRYEENPRLYRVLAADLLGGPAMAADLIGDEA
jgi:hypothetical protein